MCQTLMSSVIFTKSCVFFILHSKFLCYLAVELSSFIAITELTNSLSNVRFNSEKFALI